MSNQPNKAHWYFRVHSQCPEPGPAAQQLHRVECSSPALCPGFCLWESLLARKWRCTLKVTLIHALPLGLSILRHGCLETPLNPSEYGDQGSEGGDRKMTVLISLIFPWKGLQDSETEKGQLGLTIRSLHPPPHLSPSSSIFGVQDRPSLHSSPSRPRIKSRWQPPSLVASGCRAAPNSLRSGSRVFPN